MGIKVLNLEKLKVEISQLSLDQSCNSTLNNQLKTDFYGREGTW
jgi:hypothetical protein